jgi:hypothetical protein
MAIVHWFFEALLWITWENVSDLTSHAWPKTEYAKAKHT